MAKTLLIGAAGQVGWELSRSLLPLGELTVLTRKECDLSNKDALVDIIRDLHPDTIVNAAAYTAVDKAESDLENAKLVNSEIPAILASEAKALNALLVDYSTDYVFDGVKEGEYLETDTPCPVSVYGQTKLKGLEAIQQSDCRHLVFRVSWVYGRQGGNFVKTMLSLAKTRNELKIVADQFGSPTPADLIADVTAQSLCMLSQGKGEEGLFNLVPSGKTTWFGFAESIFEYASEITEDTPPKLFPVSTSEFPTPAKRPVNSLLNTDKLESTFGLYMPDWQVPLKRIIREIVR